MARVNRRRICRCASGLLHDRTLTLKNKYKTALIYIAASLLTLAYIIRLFSGPVVKPALTSQQDGTPDIMVMPGTSYPAIEDIGTADYVEVYKSQRMLRLMADGNVVREYRISLGDNPDGHKLQEGDERTPEGNYTLDWRNPNSRFYKSIHISYPNAEDRRAAAKAGVSPGGAIMIHGQPKEAGWIYIASQYLDWTDGCIAVSNNDMDEIWQLVEDGTPIQILP